MLLIIEASHGAQMFVNSVTKSQEICNIEIFVCILSALEYRINQKYLPSGRQTLANNAD